MLQIGSTVRVKENAYEDQMTPETSRSEAKSAR